MRNPSEPRQSLTSRILHSLYPSYCPVCGRRSDVFDYSPICSRCWSGIARYRGPSCGICGLPFASELGRICGTCMKKRPPFSKTVVFGIYEGPLAEAVHQLKFYGLRRLAGPLAGLMMDLDIPGTDGIIAVPMTKKGLMKRGFNQSLLLARTISKNMKVPLYPDALRKKRETLPQIGLTSRERMSNLRNAFEVRGNVIGLSLLLVDDVMTTGATVSECAKELLKAGAGEVTVAALARARLD